MDESCQIYRGRRKGPVCPIEFCYRIGGFYLTPHPDPGADAVPQNEDRVGLRYFPWIRALRDPGTRVPAPGEFFSAVDDIDQAIHASMDAGGRQPEGRGRPARRRCALNAVVDFDHRVMIESPSFDRGTMTFEGHDMLNPPKGLRIWQFGLYILPVESGTVGMLSQRDQGRAGYFFKAVYGTESLTPEHMGAHVSMVKPHGLRMVIRDPGGRFDLDLQQFPEQMDEEYSDIVAPVIEDAV